jgi:hypothetical protein
MGADPCNIGQGWVGEIYFHTLLLWRTKFWSKVEIICDPFEEPPPFLVKHRDIKECHHELGGCEQEDSKEGTKRGREKMFVVQRTKLGDMC